MDRTAYLEEQLGLVEGERDALKDKVARLEADVFNAEATMRSIAKDRADLQNDRDELRVVVDSLSAQLRDLRAHNVRERNASVRRNCIPDTGATGEVFSDPQHYTNLKPQPWDVIRSWGLHRDYWLASALEYIARAGKKPGNPYDKDIAKAIRYLHEAIDVWQLEHSE
jgi:hypothetical protein